MSSAPDDPTLLDPEPLRRLEAASPGISVAVLEVFTRDLRAFVAAAPADPLAADAEAMRRAAHKLKGAAGSIGARQIQACALRLEHACRDSGTVAPDMLAEVVNAVRRFLDRPAG